MPRIGRRVALVLLVCAQPAIARDYYYFSKPGVSREAYLAEAGECAELVGGARAPVRGPVYVTYPDTTYGAYGAAIGLLLAGLLLGDEDKSAQRSVERTCMADKGYARMKVDKKMIRDIERLKDEQERLERLFSLASADAPIGTRLGE